MYLAALKNSKPTKIVSTDSYFVDERTGEFKFDAGSLPKFHKKAIEKARSLLADGNKVIIDNTNSRFTHMLSYFIHLNVKRAVIYLRVETEEEAEYCGRCSSKSIPPHASVNTFKQMEELTNISMCSLPVFF